MSEPTESFDELTRRLIQYKAARLVRVRPFHRRDRADLEQDLYVRALARLRHYAAALGPFPPFAIRAVEQAACNALRDRRARKRRADPALSLNDLAVDPDGRTVEHGELLPDGRADGRADHLAHDVAAVLAALPDVLRDLAVRLMTRSQTEIARDTGVSRHAVARAVRRLRRHFRAAGLDPGRENPRASEPPTGNP